MCAAARMAEGTLPTRSRSVARTTSATLATRAGITFMSPVHGYAAPPPAGAHGVGCPPRGQGGESAHGRPSHLLARIARSLGHLGDRLWNARGGPLEPRLVGVHLAGRGPESRRDAQPVVSQRPPRRR